MSQYHEPWHIGFQLDYTKPPRWPCIDDARNMTIFYPENEERAIELLPTLERIVACVNALQGIDNDTLATSSTRHDTQPD